MFIIKKMPALSLSRFRNKKINNVEKIERIDTIRTWDFLKSFSILFLMSKCLNPTSSIYIHRKYPPIDAKTTKRNPNEIRDSGTSLAHKINIDIDKAIMPKYISRNLEGFIFISLSILKLLIKIYIYAICPLFSIYTHSLVRTISPFAHLKYMSFRCHPSFPYYLHTLVKCKHIPQTASALDALFLTFARKIFGGSRQHLFLFSALPVVARIEELFAYVNFIIDGVPSVIQSVVW